MCFMIFQAFLTPKLKKNNKMTKIAKIIEKTFF
jgi:hypothetical protein